MPPFAPRSLAPWFDAYAPRLVLYARQWLDAEAAQDAAQEAFVRLLGQRRGPANVPAWLFLTTRRIALDRLRGERRRRGREREVARGSAAWFAPRADDAIDAAAAQAALMTLGPARREVVVLRLWGGLSVADAAAVVGRPPSTVFDEYKAALAELRGKLETTCDTTRSTTTTEAAKPTRH